MGATWIKDNGANDGEMWEIPTTQPSTVSPPDDGGSYQSATLNLRPPTGTHGLFVMVHSAVGGVTIPNSSNYTDSCDSPCFHSACVAIGASVENPSVPIIIHADDDIDRCDSVPVVVGFASSKVVNNRLYFAHINVCNNGADMSMTPLSLIHI